MYAVDYIGETDGKVRTTYKNTVKDAKFTALVLKGKWRHVSEPPRTLGDFKA